MISEKLQKAINDQVKAEMWSANLYLAMSFYFKRNSYDGFANWMKKQSDEEMDHAMQLADYVMKRGGVITVDAIDAVDNECLSAFMPTNVMYHNSSMLSLMLLLRNATRLRKTSFGDLFASKLKKRLPHKASLTKSRMQARLKPLSLCSTLNSALANNSAHRYKSTKRDYHSAVSLFMTISQAGVATWFCGGVR